MPDDPDDLDDFDLDPTRRRKDADTEVPPHSPTRRGGLLFPVTLVAVAVLALGLLGVMFLVFRHPTPARTALPATAAPTLPPPPAAPTPAPSPLPPLDSSDPTVRELASALSPSPQLTRWLAQSDLVRTLTAVVSNVAEGETPRPHLAFLAPRERFRATGGPGRRIVPDPASFRGYDGFADGVASVDAAVAARVYRVLEPLFDSAYRDLGHPDGRFDRALDRAIEALLAVPVLGPDTPLEPHAIGFRYVDPRLERLSAAQKQLLRIGPRNVRLVQGKLRELKEALAAGVAAPAGGQGSSAP